MEAPMQSLTPSTPYRSIEAPLSNSTSYRGQTTQRSKSRVDAMLERALTQPQQCSVDPLDNAVTWGIPIWHTHELVAWLDKIYNSLKETNNLKRENQFTATKKDIKVKQLKEPYLKFESYEKAARPVFLELKNWPKLNFDGEPGTCPFAVKVDDTDKEKLQKQRDTKENCEKFCNSNARKEKDMTRRPKATATRARKSENTGYCEICRTDYSSLSKHLQSVEHKNFIKDDNNFLSLDNLISTGTSVDDFLKFNKHKTDSNDCELFSNGDSNIENGVVPSPPRSKSDRRASVLSRFKVKESNNMVQCNGARRNLGLTLDAPHNLRTRAKHESGHLLRSKAKPFVEEVKNHDRPFPGYTIKKVAKGTFWIEEEDAEDEKKDLSENGNETNFETNSADSKCGVTVNGDVKMGSILSNNSAANLVNGHADENSLDNVDLKSDILTCTAKRVVEVDDNPLHSVTNKRGKPNIRGRPRLSIDERLIEDNRDYYKVEVLGSKLRSSSIPTTNMLLTSSKENVIPPDKGVNKGEVEEQRQPSSEKPVVMKFKRVRKSELSLLSDEAECFMFGEKKDDSEDSADEQSSVLPRDTESDRDIDKPSDPLPSSSIHDSSPVKIWENLQDTAANRKKKRRTQTEALLKDNCDYYKFETPGSRLRFQAPFTGIKEPTPEKFPHEPSDPENSVDEVIETLYPSQPSAEVEKFKFSFETIPKSEPWYQTYQRQDEGAEFWHYFSEIDVPRPFQLPYEIDNFYQKLYKDLQKHKRLVPGQQLKGRKLLNSLARSPRKSPRCHASTLAIMSTIIRKREQQQRERVSIIHHTPPPIPVEIKSEVKSDNIDEELSRIAESVEKMLSASEESIEEFDPSDYSEFDDVITTSRSDKRISGAPADLVMTLLDDSQEAILMENNSSCASSECGSSVVMRRRKKRKNKTGWPGSKLRRKLCMRDLVMRRRAKQEALKNSSPEALMNLQRSNNTTLSDPLISVNKPKIGEVKVYRGRGRPRLYPTSPLKTATTTNNEEEASTSGENKSPKIRVYKNRKLKEMGLRKHRKKKLIKLPGEEKEEEESPVKPPISPLPEPSTPKKSPRRKLKMITPKKSPRKLAVETKMKQCKKLKQKYIKNIKNLKNNVKPLRGRKRKKELTSSEMSSTTPRKKYKKNKHLDRPSSVASSDQRRSSIDLQLQPVVRVRKIDEHQVAVASSRRLRSSSSPKTSPRQKRKKKFKHQRTRSPVKRLLKNS